MLDLLLCVAFSEGLHHAGDCRPAIAYVFVTYKFSLQSRAENEPHANTFGHPHGPS